MDIKYITSLSDLPAARDEILSAEVIGADVETTGFQALEEEMTLLQLSPNPDKAFVFNIRKLSNPDNFTFLKDVLASDRIVMFQNGTFDLQFLRHLFNESLKVESHYDTMYCSILLARGNKAVRHGLGEITRRELNIELDKSLQKSDFGAAEISEAQIEYAARDACILHKTRDAQKAKLSAWGLERVARLECDAVAPIADTEYNGFYLDKEEWSARVQRQSEHHRELEKEIYKLITPATPVIDLWGDPVINLDSPQQLAPALRNLGLSVAGSVDEAVLKNLKGKHPIIEPLLEYREMATALKKFGLDYLKHVSSVDGRIHADFQQIEAPSGRMSCRHPNLQQVPAEEEYRHHFKAQREGGYLITADYSQIELRIMAKQSEDPVLVQAYMNGEDLHNVTAHRVLGEPFENPDPMKRRLAKNCNFGTTYGVSPEGFAATAGVSIKFAEQVLKKYWETYHVLGDYLRGQASLAADQGRAYTMSGRTAVLFVDRNDQTAYSAARRLGRNFCAQGTGADILKRALYLLRNAFILRGFLASYVVNIVHDEIVIETYDDPEAVSRVTQQVMTEAGHEFLGEIPCEVGIKTGVVWQK